jgi:hypothetical protein
MISFQESDEIQIRRVGKRQKMNIISDSESEAGMTLSLNANSSANWTQ